MSRDSKLDKIDPVLNKNIKTKQTDNAAQEPELIEKTLGIGGAEDLSALQNVLCPYEVSSIQSMMEYVSEQQGVDIQEVRKMVETEFGVDRIQFIQRNDFRAVITFLIDIRFDERRTA